jgi:hypothetical protein
MVDIGPTLLDLAGVPVPEYMDGHSWKPFLLASPETGGESGGSASRVVVPVEAVAWRDVALVEYQSVRTYGGRHQIDGPNNTYIALRIVNSFCTRSSRMCQRLRIGTLARARSTFISFTTSLQTTST